MPRKSEDAPDPVEGTLTAEAPSGAEVEPTTEGDLPPDEEREITEEEYQEELARVGAHNVELHKLNPIIDGYRRQVARRQAEEAAAEAPVVVENPEAAQPASRLVAPERAAAEA